MSENNNKIITALLEQISVLARELAETRKLLEEKGANQRTGRALG